MVYKFNAVGPLLILGYNVNLRLAKKKTLVPWFSGRGKYRCYLQCLFEEHILLSNGILCHLLSPTCQQFHTFIIQTLETLIELNHFFRVESIILNK